jgi:RNA-directed DNA polymerase
MEQILSKRKKDYPLKAERFRQLRYTYQFGSLLRVNSLILNFHINKPIYFNFQIPKKNGGTRNICSPNEDLKNLQSKLNVYLQAMYYYSKPKCVHGFVYSPYSGSAKNYIVTNAQEHCNKKHVLNMDIKDFFPSISAKQVCEALVNEPFNMSDEVAVIIALLGTYKKALPTGAPTSPILSNIVCIKMDKQLEEFCLKSGLTYTRYADDLTFSSNEVIKQEIIQDLKGIINASGFKLNEKKFRLISSKGKQVVTGLVVNKKVNVDRKYIRRLRAMLHSWSKMGVELAAAKHFKARALNPEDVAKFVRKLHGQIGFVGQVRGNSDTVYLRLNKKFEANLKL